MRTFLDTYFIEHTHTKEKRNNKETIIASVNNEKDFI